MWWCDVMMSAHPHPHSSHLHARHPSPWSLSWPAHHLPILHHIIGVFPSSQTSNHITSNHTHFNSSFLKKFKPQITPHLKSHHVTSHHITSLISLTSHHITSHVGDLLLNEVLTRCEHRKLGFSTSLLPFQKATRTSIPFVEGSLYLFTDFFHKSTLTPIPFIGVLQKNSNLKSHLWHFITWHHITSLTFHYMASHHIEALSKQYP